MSQNDDYFVLKELYFHGCPILNGAGFEIGVLYLLTTNGG